MTLEEKVQRKHLISFVRKGNLIPQDVGQPEGFNKETHLRLLYHLGFRNIEEHYSFFSAKFPKGWKLFLPPMATYWCYLVDEQGRKRAAFIYKFLGYNKRVFNPNAGKVVKTMQVNSLVNYVQRFRVQIDHIIKYNNVKKNMEEHKNSPIVGRILDGDKVIYETGFLYNHYAYSGGENKLYAADEKKIRDIAFNDCQSLLEALYPDNTSILKYWGFVTPEDLEKQTAGTNVILTQRLADTNNPKDVVTRKEIARGVITNNQSVVLTVMTKDYHYEEKELSFLLIKLREIQVEVFDSAVNIPEEQLNVAIENPESATSEETKSETSQEEEKTSDVPA